LLKTPFWKDFIKTANKTANAIDAIVISVRLLLRHRFLQINLRIILL
jgi:hypothetical protein